jgi:hypothetical protein
MDEKPPERRLHTMRMGDGRALPAGEPPELWPDFGVLEPYWESFAAFARSELDQPTVSFELRNHGKWRFVARDRLKRDDDSVSNQQTRMSLTYDPEEDEIEFSDPETGSGWVMEDAFGGDPFTMRR